MSANNSYEEHVINGLTQSLEDYMATHDVTNDDCTCECFRCKCFESGDASTDYVCCCGYRTVDCDCDCDACVRYSKFRKSGKQMTEPELDRQLLLYMRGVKYERESYLTESVDTVYITLSNSIANAVQKFHISVYNGAAPEKIKQYALTLDAIAGLTEMLNRL